MSDHFCTIAGLILFGYTPRRLIPQAGIRWIAFAGEDKSYQALDDRLIDEPLVAGALPNSMTIEKMIAGQRSPRNSLIVDVLRDYGYVDARGMGVRHKIIPLLREYNGVEPQFQATEDFLKVTLGKGT